MNINIDFQEGFKNDTVEVAAGDKILFRAENVSTRMQIGLAKSVEIELDKNQRDITVKIPSRNLAERAQIKPNVRYIGASINAEGKLALKFSETLFGYV